MDNRTRLHLEVRDVIVCQMPIEERVEMLLEDYCRIALENRAAGLMALEIIAAYQLAHDNLFGILPDVTKHTN